MTSTDIALLQLLTTVFGGTFALYLFIRSNIEKRQSFVLSIYDKLYGDKEIAKLLYAADKGNDLEKLKEKVERRIIIKADMEEETDKALRYFDFVGALLKQGHLKKTDLVPFRYEIRTILKNPIIEQYLNYLRSIDVCFENIDYLLKAIDSSEK